MNLEDQITSLEISKQLKELGVKQNSYFKYEVHLNEYFEIYHSKATSCAHKYYSAFTATELLNLLPNQVTLKEGDTFINNFRLFMTVALMGTNDDLDSFKRNFIVNYESDILYPQDRFKRYLDKNKYDVNLANALAKMIIYLIENKLMELSV